IVGTPSFFVCGLLVPGAPEFAKAIGMTEELPQPTTALIYTYAAIAVGDIQCGIATTLLGSRKGALLIFHLITAASIASCFLYPPRALADFYLRCVLMGIGLGYWGNMATNAAEQFSTHIRGTVAIADPNQVRCLLLPISLSFWSLQSHFGFVNTSILVGTACSLLGIIATLSLPDGYKLNLEHTGSGTNKNTKKDLLRTSMAIFRHDYSSSSCHGGAAGGGGGAGGAGAAAGAGAER